MAAAAIDLLLRETRAGKDGDAVTPTDLVVPHTLITRQSSGAPPA
jgi:hypothetical protein